MLKGIDLNELARRITANQSLKRDYIAPSNTLRMTADSDGTTKLHVMDQGEFPILPIAHRQLSTFVKIPADYYDRMKADAPDLLANNVNRWFERFPVDNKRMVRTLGGDTRALLSNSYQRIEHEHIAAVALPILSDLKGVKIVSCEITDRRLYIHFVVETVQGEVKRGDWVQAGGIISNSEIGFGAVSVSGLLWRLECLNGMKSGHTFRRAHVGRQVEDSEALWADDTKKADDHAVLLKVRDMVKAVVDETSFKQNLLKMQGLVDPKITGNIQKSVEVLSNTVGLPSSMQGDILQSLAAGGDLSAWGMLNAVTQQAHKATNYDDAVEIEAAGGALLNLAPGEWQRILVAA